MRNEEIVLRVKEDRNPCNKRKEGERDSHIFRRNCLLRHVTGGQVKGNSEWKTRKKK